MYGYIYNQLPRRKGNEKSEFQQILEEEHSHVRMLTLNRPQKLNALSARMVDQLVRKFKAYSKNPNVKLVILKARGKAFCAGGDVAALAHFITDGHWSFGPKFYSKLLKMVYATATSKKPQVSLINGIVMGGGAGASMHGKFRVVTENAIFAMPETLIGLCPDVGASYFLSRLPGFFGEYLGLTSTRLGAEELVACGLATHFVPSENLPMLEEALKRANSSDPASVSAIIDEFALRPVLKDNHAFASCRLEIINKCFSKGTAEEILSALEDEAANRWDESFEWIDEAIKAMKRASPLALKVFLRSIREGREQDIRLCLTREYRIICHILLRTVSTDYYEGYSSILLRKDRQPKWDPPKLELVTREMVDRFFTKVEDEDWEDLKLPVRTDHANPIQAKL